VIWLVLFQFQENTMTDKKPFTMPFYALKSY
jgi:hypothetical protein